MSLTCQIKIILNDISKEKAIAIKKALGPDNVNFPKGQSLLVENIEDKLVFRFKSTQDLRKMIGTIDEVLEHVQVALKVIE